MAAMGGLSPLALQRSLGQVGAAAGRAVGALRTDLKQSPPHVDRPSGAPAEHPPTANTAELAAKIPATQAGHVDALPAGRAGPAATPAPIPQLEPPPPLKAPAIAGDAKVEAGAAAQMHAAVDNLPTTDPALDVTAGEAPALALTGDADPKRKAEQRAKLDQAAADARQQGAKDASQPMGEQAVYPDTPAETLRATIPDEAGAAGGADVGGDAAGAGGGPEEESASIVAQEQHGDEIQAQVTNQSAAMQTAPGQARGRRGGRRRRRARPRRTTRSTRAQSSRTSAHEGRDRRRHAAEGHGAGKQDDAVKAGDEKADTISKDADTEITGKQDDGVRRATGAIHDGNEEIGTARKTAEEKAKAERDNAKKESEGGVFEWIGSKVKAFFDRITTAIGKAFDDARKAVKTAIKKAQDLAVQAIDAARDAIVKAIKKAGDLLLKAGDFLLAAFPELREKFKKAITDLVNDAVKAVNALADTLKKTVLAALDLLGKGLDLLLGGLLDQLKQAIASVKAFVKDVINTAKSFVQRRKLGALGPVIKDIAANPGQWIRNLGAAVVDGIKHHLITALGTAIKNWFHTTVETVIGVGKSVLEVLKKLRGLTWADVGKMAWEALKAAVPSILIGLLIEKLVAMIVPAAGAIMTIIQGVQAALGTIKQIIAAIESFFNFLKAVKSGTAGPLFATMLASAAIVVIQFVASWLLKKLMKPGAKVGGKLGELAKKILDGLKKAAKAVVGAVKKVVKAVVKAVKTIVKYVKKGVQWVAGKVKAVVQKLANSNLVKAILNSKIVQKIVGVVKKIGEKIKAAYQKAKKKFEELKEKAKKKWEEWKKKAVERRFKKGLDAVRRLVKAGTGEDGISIWLFNGALGAIRRLRIYLARLRRKKDSRGNEPTRRRPRRDVQARPPQTEPGFPEPETKETVHRDFKLSRSLHQRLFAFKPKGSTNRRYVFHATGDNVGSWSGILPNEDVAKAEAAARQHLQDTKNNYIPLLTPTKTSRQPA